MKVYSPAQVAMGKVYSPAQVAMGAFLGGPIAMVYVLKKNFEVLENNAAAKKTLILGSIFVLSLVLLLPFLPDNFPNYALPFAYCITARMIANKYQLTKSAIAQSPRFTFQSNWKVFGMAVGFLAVFMALVIGWIFAIQVMPA
jgi:hypothetical protein